MKNQVFVTVFLFCLTLSAIGAAQTVRSTVALQIYNVTSNYSFAHQDADNAKLWQQMNHQTKEAFLLSQFPSAENLNSANFCKILERTPFCSAHDFVETIAYGVTLECEGYSKAIDGMAFPAIDGASLDSNFISEQVAAMSVAIERNCGAVWAWQELAVAKIKETLKKAGMTKIKIAGPHCDSQNADGCHIFFTRSNEKLK